MKLFTASLIFFLFTNFSQAQTVLLQEDFTTYDGTSGTTPTGWTISSHGFYSTVASSGTSGPNSYGFKVDNATITTPVFSDADSVSFWIERQGGDTASTLFVYETLDGITWTLIDSLAPLPTTGVTQILPVQSTSIQLQFIYSKSTGNLAFDDFKVLRNPPTTVTSNFSANNICFGDTVKFTDLSSTTGGSAVTSWMWHFGDGMMSSAQNPAYVYTTADTFDVELTVMDNMGNTDDTIMQVIVYPKPITGFADTTQSCGATTFLESTTISSGSIVSYFWNFGNGETSTNSGVQVVIYEEGGVYPVTLTVTSDKGCIDTDSGLAIIYQPITNFEFNIVDSTVTFTDSSYAVLNDTIVGWDWGFGDGTNSSQQNPVHTYSDTGTYETCLYVTTAKGCFNNICKLIIISPTLMPPVASFSLSSDIICLGDTLFVMDNSSNGTGGPVVDYEWYFGDGTANEFTENASHVYTAAGPYDIILTVFDSVGNFDDTTITVNVFDLPGADFIANDSLGCDPFVVAFGYDSTGASEWLWNFGDSITSTDENPSHTYSTPGTYDLELIVTSAEGCMATLLKEDYITVYGQPAAIFNANPNNLSVTFTNTSLYNASNVWDFGDGSTSTITSPTHVYTASGTYNVCLKVTSGADCEDSVCQTITVMNVGVNEKNGKNELLSVYPNPSNGIFNIVALNEPSKITVVDVVGKTVFEKSLVTGTNVSLDLSSQASGIYFVKVQDNEGITTRKITLNR